MCCYKRYVLWGGREGGIWLDVFLGLNPGLLCRERLQLTQPGGSHWETSVTEGGGGGAQVVPLGWPKSAGHNLLCHLGILSVELSNDC